MILFVSQLSDESDSLMVERIKAFCRKHSLRICRLSRPFLFPTGISISSLRTNTVTIIEIGLWIREPSVLTTLELKSRLRSM